MRQHDLDVIPQTPTMYGVSAFDPLQARKDFPILDVTVHGRPLVYLDNAATTQKPTTVIEAMHSYYSEKNSNVHRGVHHLSQVATAMYEAARDRVASFINASHSREIIFTRGTTEAINLVAYSFGQRFREGDEIVISTIEHHSNIVPWQMLCERSGAVLRVIPVDDNGDLDLEAYAALLGPRTKLVSVVHVSNALGTVNPVREMIRMAHDAGARVLLDAAQSIQHLPIDVQEMDCDFLAFSGHKLYGPTGIGVLYGKRELLESMPPWQGGGDMILTVTFEKTTYNQLPYKFEAGTPNIAGAIGLAAAIGYYQSLDLDAVMAHENALLAYATRRMREVTGLSIVGNAKVKASVASFTLCAIHPHDIGTILDKHGVAIRAGHHCAQPTMKRFNIPATARASFALYNTTHDVDALLDGIQHVLEVFA